jgi:tetratricopeptide (TPR) repeat protein
MRTSHTNTANLTFEELCEQVSVLEAVGQHEEAEGILGEVWPSVFADPQVESLPPHLQALSLVRIAALISSSGSTRRLPNAQERARGLAQRARDIAAQLDDRHGQAEALCELGRIERRMGNTREGLRLLDRALELASDGGDRYLLGRIQLRRAIYENAEQNFATSLSILQDSALLFDAPLWDAPTRDLKKLALVGDYFNTRGLVHRNLALQERSWEFFDAGYRDLTAAQFFFSQAGHNRYEAAALNNLALFALVHHDFIKAYEYIDRARLKLKFPTDVVFIVQVEETRARIFAAEGRFEDAERVIEQAVEILKETSDTGLLQEVLVVRDTIFSARNNPAEANRILKIERPKFRLISGGEERTIKPAREIVTCKVNDDDESLTHLGFPPGSIIPFEASMRAHEGQFVLCKIMPGDTACVGFYYLNADGRTLMIETGHPDYEPRFFPVWRVHIRGVHRQFLRLRET